MKTVWRDTIAAVLALAGGVVMFAKLQSYSWWLIGSWAGALGVLAVIGLAILATNVAELVQAEDMVALFEMFAWTAVATVVIASLFAVTSQAEFIWSGILIAVAWLSQTTRHIWRGTHHTHGHLITS